MDFVLKQREFNGYKENVLELCFNEDFFNDPEYKLGGKKYLELKEKCEKVILDNLSKLPLKDEKTGATFPGKIIFNINAVPDIANTKKNEGILLIDLRNFFAELAGLATEKTLGIKLEERKKRRWFLKVGAPVPQVDASGASDTIQKKISTSGCWGCYGLITHFAKEHENDNEVCPLF